MADETKLTAATRLEKLLDNIAGGDNEVTPATRLEKFLSYIADAMEGGGGSGGGGGGELPVYEIKGLPVSVGYGYYIDGDPAEITSGPCIILSNDGLTKYFPVYMYTDEGYYSLAIITDTGENLEAIINIYDTGNVIDLEYANKLCHMSGGPG